MICFLDRTFCGDTDCQCDYPKFTDEMRIRAENWWNPERKPEKKGGAPICFVIHEKSGVSKETAGVTK